MRSAALLALLLLAPALRAEDGQVLFRVKSPLIAFALNPDGKFAALALADKSVRLIDLAVGNDVRTLPGPAAALTFSPDGTTLTAGGKGVKLWKVATGELTATLVKDDAGIVSLSYRGDGKVLAIGSPAGGARLLDVTSGVEMAAFKLPHYGVTAVALSPDGKWLAAGGAAMIVPPPPGMPVPHTTQVWDVAARSPALDCPWPAPGGPLAFSPEGKTLTIPAIGGLERYDLTTRKQRVHLVGHLEPPSAVALSPDGRLLASGDSRGLVRLWDAVTDEDHPFTRKAGGAVRGLAFTPGSKALISAEVSAEGETIIRSYDPADDRRAYFYMPLVHEPFALAVSPQGGVSAATDGGIDRWDMKTGRALPPLKEHAYGLDAAAFSADGKTLLTLDRSATLRLWDVATGNVTLTRPKVGKFAAALSADGKSMAVEAGNDVTVLNAKGEELFTLTGHRKAVTALAFAPDGKTLVSAGQDHKVKWWDAANGKSRGEAAHSAAVTCLAMSPDGKRIAAGGEDGTAVVWDASTREEIARLAGHAKSVRVLAFSPDSATLASGSADGLLILWDVAQKKERVKIANAGGPTCAAFTPDGKTLLSAGESRLVQFWDAATGREKPRP